MNEITLLSVNEICSILQISRRTFYELAKRGELPVFKVGGEYRAEKSNLVNWIEKKSREIKVAG